MKTSGERNIIVNQSKSIRMNTAQTLTQMLQLKLMGMHHAYQTQLELPLHQQLEGQELLEHLIQMEVTYRTDHKTHALLKAAKLRLAASINQVECNPARNLSKQQLALLAEGNYIRQAHNMLITGATGCGYVN